MEENNLAARYRPTFAKAPYSAQKQSSFIDKITRIRPLASDLSELDPNSQFYQPTPKRSVEEENFFLQEGLQEPGKAPSSDKTGGEKVKFERTLTLVQLIYLNIGNTIGSGIFVLTGIASKYAGAGVFVSFIITGFISLLTAMVYAEFSSRMPFSGSAYQYIYSTFGELPAWIVGWNLNLRYGITAGAQSRAFSSYLVLLLTLIGLSVPKALYSLEFAGINGSLIAVAYLVFCTILANRGMKESSLFNQIFTSTKLSLLVFIVVVNVFNFSWENFSPFLTEEFGGYGLIRGASLLYFSYIGFDLLTAVAEECHNPVRDIPRAIMSSIAVITFIYITISFTINGVGKLQDVHDEAAMAVIYELHGMKWMALLVCFTAFLGIAASDFTNILSQSRIFYSYARDGLFFPIFSELNPVTKVPTKGAWITCAGACTISFFMNLESLTKLINVGTLINYSIVQTAVIALRFRQQDQLFEQNYSKEKYAWLFLLTSFLFAMSVGYSWNLAVVFISGGFSLGIMIFLCFLEQAPLEDSSIFHCPLVPIVPCLGVFLNFVLCAGMPMETWVAFIIFELVGACFYFFYGYHNGVLNKKIAEQEMKQLN